MIRSTLLLATILLASPALAEGDGTFKASLLAEMHRDQERTRQWLAGQPQPGAVLQPSAAFATGALMEAREPRVRRPAPRIR